MMMKGIMLVFAVVLAFTACSSYDALIKEESCYKDIRKIIITGLPAVTSFGEDVKVEIGYFPAGDSPYTSKQKFTVYAESGEYLFPDGIDIYWLGMIPAINPPEYQFNLPKVCDINDNVLTINVKKIIRSGFEVQKLIINGLPAVTSMGEDVQVVIGYLPSGDSPQDSEQVFETYTESGEYLFPDGIDIHSMGFLPEEASEYYFNCPSTEDHVFIINVTKW
jgi:hypothetical protein